MVRPDPLITRLVLGMLQTNCYLIVCQETLSAMVIDPADSVDRIISVAQRRGARIEQILLTHAHLDHIAALPALRAATGARVLAHPREVEMFGTYLRLFGLGPAQFPPLQVDVELRGGEDVAIGQQTGSVIHCPGHSEGGLALSLGNALFTGDTLFAQGVGRVDLPGGNPDHILLSVRRLLEYPDDTIVYPGHGAESTIGIEKTDNPYV